MANDNQNLPEEKMNSELSTADFDLIDASKERQDLVALEEKLKVNKVELEDLIKESSQIGNPKHLGNVITKVVWEQFMNQMGVTAGEDFIKENGGMTLDLSDEAHIQTTDNFANGKIATHNKYIDYQGRYDYWQAQFQRDENGNIKTYVDRTGKKVPILVKGARRPYDAKRPKGSKEKGTDMDHIRPAKEIIIDPAANAHLSLEERVELANSPDNLQEIPSRVNQSKGDKNVEEYLDHPNSNGQKANEIYPEYFNPEREKEWHEKDHKAKEAIDKRIKEGEERSKELGKQSQKEEAFRFGGKALRTAVMSLIAALLKDIMAGMVKWLMSSSRTISTLCDRIVDAVKNFIHNLKEHLVNVADSVATMILTSIIGPVFGLLKKTWMLLKQAGHALKEAIDYFRNPANKQLSFEKKIMEAGKILIAGLTGVGAIALSEFIMAGLSSIPVFDVQIPIIGSLAEILGTFFGAVAAGIIGAIAINYIEKKIAEKEKRENVGKRIDKGNEVLSLQMNRQNLGIIHEAQIKEKALNSISQRHREASSQTREDINEILSIANDIKGSD